MAKGKWRINRYASVTEQAYGICSICKHTSPLPTECYYLATDVTGLERCPYCNSEMEFYFKSFS